jgi:hypothetical protein
MHRHHAEAAAALTRRRFLTGAGAVALAGALSAASARRAAADTALERVELGSQPAGLPARQHAWTAVLHRDEFGNPVAPRFDRLLFFDVRGRPSSGYALLLESRLRALERRFDWRPEGLLFTVGYGPDYFATVLGVASPVERATRLASFESPAIDAFHVCVHLACDDAQRLIDVEASLRRGLAPILRWRETRTGFTGRGLPHAHRSDVAADSPLFMGFKSGLRKNQASEDTVTIAAGPFAQGTTMQVSYMELALDQWYGLSAADRVALMYSPQTTVAAAGRFRTDAAGEPSKVIQALSRYGMVGHAQTSALARRHGSPVIIRRDFDTVDGGRPGLHFVSLQRSIEDFVATRNAMNATGARNINPHVTGTHNNGINAFIDVRRRANYILPSRAHRSFPLLAA